MLFIPVMLGSLAHTSLSGLSLLDRLIMLSNVFPCWFVPITRSGLHSVHAIAMQRYNSISLVNILILSPVH